MGYNIEEIRLSARLDNHLGPQTHIDRAAFDRFKEELEAMIDADPEYARIFNGRIRPEVIARVQ